MSSKTKAHGAGGGAVTPRLRFPKFRDATGWKAMTLGHLFSDRQETGQSDLPLLSLTDKEGIVPQENTNRKNNSNSDKSKYLRVVPGDIAYNTMRMWEGRSAHVGLEGLVSPAYTVCQPETGTNSLFFSHYFKTPQLIEQFRRYSQGLVKDTLNLKYEAFSKILVQTPPASEQQKIAECLSSVDELIAAQARKVDALKTHRKGLMQQLFPREGETQPRRRFPEFQHAGGWEERPLAEIAPLQRGFDLPSDAIRPGNVPIVYSNGPKGFHEIGMAQGPGIVTGRSGTIGKLHFVEEGDYWPHNTSLWVTSFQGNQPKFIFYLFESIGFLRFASGSGVPTLNRNDAHVYVASIAVDLDEQQRIAHFLTSLDDLIATQSQKLEAFKTHKKALMQQLFPSTEEG